ncbi:GntR family transcriptional regulator [Sphaerisporangium krabiense]|uniref:DNA-binding transcriptional regulator YhcF (GntR family) n=1 Tax=Sphaerisporangium krabiense TaxID=763782 RepID=A0A7W8Z1H3_9ACTN|nr:TetR/AcrR family transcriptional regulator C-terminal domain-containing protein [Sphaerisporangium krabiense]MBB5625676.1 DNA-binding transcriptional regulator YhcF (GntR family) [Sphaerisporangium krabiense]GII62988.1 GntR family transcriptional regulator [Sphaerisporangium krabiense]
MDGPAPHPEPPYLRIAGEIRRRIATGELRAGDPVPSTREITRRWGVAMATATKALTALRQEGLVRAVPGVGTVVQAPPPREAAPAPRTPPSRAGDHELTRERVVRAGIEIADAEGLAALSMRRVAAALGVAVMSLYRHVPGKDELVTLMTDAVYAAHPPGPDAPDWRRALEETARLMWAVYRRHPWLPHAVSMTRPQLSVGGLAHTDRVIRALAGAGLGPNARLHAAITVIGFVRGVGVNLEPENLARQDTGLTEDEWMNAQPAFAEVLAAGSFPGLAAVVTSPEADLDLDTLFEFGLARLLDGLAVLIDRAAG